MMTIIKHIPALQVIIPLFGALFSAISFRVNFARIIAIAAIMVSFIISLYGFLIVNDVQDLFYLFGDWPAPIGIEYRLDVVNQPVIIFINFTLLFFLVFCNHLTKYSILDYIDEKRQHLFYTILLFAQTGYIGMVSTNDLFNLYVFIEISSLSAYILMAHGNNPKAVIGAFDYLMLGTIGATLILIGIGFLLSHTGSLNISDIQQRLGVYYDSRILLTGISFFIVGIILKISLFPMHFWMIRAYSSSPPVILTYLASISSIIGAYLFIRFVHFAIDYNHISELLSIFLRVTSLATIIICSTLAFKSLTVKKIIIYSSATQIGYVILLLSIDLDARELLRQFLLIDAINKIALFLLVSHIELEWGIIKSSVLWRILVIITLICSAGFPISSMFIVKINILNLLIEKNLWIDFVVVLLGSSIALLYHYKIAEILFFKTTEKSLPNPNYTKSKSYGLIFICMIQLLLIWAICMRFL